MLSLLFGPSKLSHGQATQSDYPSSLTQTPQHTHTHTPHTRAHSPEYTHVDTYTHTHACDGKHGIMCVNGMEYNSTIH